MAKKNKETNKDVNVKKISKKEKRKLKLNNYKATKVSTITWIYSLRIIAIAIMIFVPIFYAFAIGYDSGILTMMQYILSISPNFMKNTFQTLGLGTNPYEMVTLIVPILMWIIMAFIIFLWFFVPFLGKKTRGKRGYMAFHFFFFPLLMGGLIWLFPFIFKYFPGYFEGAENADALKPGWSTSELYFMQMIQSWDPLSPWMIVIQIINLIFVFMSINVMHECQLMKKKRLVYDDLITNPDNSKSMASYVLSGSLEFGTLEKEEIKKGYKYLKSSKNTDKDLISFLNKMKGEVIEDEDLKN